MFLTILQHAMQSPRHSCLLQASID